jgi:hypothetical protein
LNPPADGIVLRQWSIDFSAENIRHTVSAFWDAYAPVSPSWIHFWNGKVVSADSMWRYGAIIAVAVAASLIASWRAMIVLIFGQFWILVFLHVKFWGTVRHHGILFVAALAAFWIACARQDRIDEALIPMRRKVARWVPAMVLTVLLAVQTYAVFVPVYYSWRVPFSPGHSAAKLLIESSKGDEPVVMYNDGTETSLIAYVPGKKFFFPWGERWGTFTMYRHWPYRMDSLAWAQKMANEKGSSILLIETKPIADLPREVTKLGRFTTSIVDDERYYLYRILPHPLPAR